jgi:hypothetical protein
MILWEAKSLLHDLPGFIFEKVKRDCNIAAHGIASFSFSFSEWSEGVLLVESLPPCVEVSDLKICNGVCNKTLIVK